MFKTYCVCGMLAIAGFVYSSSIYSQEINVPLPTSFATKTIKKMNISILFINKNEAYFNIQINSDTISDDEFLHLFEEELITLPIVHVKYHFFEKFVRREEGRVCEKIASISSKHGIDFNISAPVSNSFGLENDLATTQSSGILMTIYEVKRDNEEDKQCYHLGISNVHNPTFTYDEVFDIVCRHIERENIAQLVVKSKNPESKRAFVQKVEEFIEAKKQHVERMEKTEWSFSPTKDAPVQPLTNGPKTEAETPKPEKK